MGGGEPCGGDGEQGLNVAMDVDHGEHAVPATNEQVNYGKRLHRVRKTVLEMLDDRGYVVEKDDMKETYEQFKEPVDKKEMTLLVPLKSSPASEDSIFVFFPEDEKVGVKKIKEYAENMKEADCNKAILVCAQDLTPFARSALEDVFKPKFNIEAFKEEELIVNITKHVLVPKHQVLTEEQKKNLLKRYRGSDPQLPRIQFDDPIARYFGLKKGEVVKIERASATAGKYVTYRLCI